MARTALFSSLRRALARALFARRRGLTDPAEVEQAWEAEKLKRRTILQWSAGAAAAVTLPAAAGCDGSEPEPEPEVQVAIIGGGIAGMHCAYRLDRAGVAFTVYEASKRVGGRMYTGRDLFPEGQICELGGELIDTGFAALWKLSEELGITLDDRWANEPAGFKREIYYIGGVEVTEETIVQQFIPVADVMAKQVEKAEADDAYFEEIDNIDLQTWLDANCPPATFAELHEILRIAYRGEYGLEADEQSCLNLLYFIDYENPGEFAIFGESDERYHTHLGNDTFPSMLAEKIGAGKIQLETKLVSVKDGAEGGYVLGFQKGDGSKVEATVDHVVFALPFTLLREVDLTGLTLSDQKRQIIDELGYGTNTKVMTGYTSRYWSTQHNAGGAVVTDLPIQQTWESSIGQEGAAGVLTNFLGGDAGVASGNGTAEEYFQTVLPDLETIWPGAQAAYVKDSAVRMHWPSHELTKGSYTCYRPGQWSFYGLEGEREGNLHFAGEHTSLEFQGFMEGGAESGGFAAAAILDDLGIAPSPQHAAILDTKLGVPQPWFGGLGKRVRLGERRRQRRAALERRLYR